MTWVEPPGDFDPHSLAEFIEAESIFSMDDYLSLSEIRNFFAIGNQPSDDQVSFAFSEIERRSNSFGSHYPFIVDDRGVLFDSGESGYLYTALLLLSLKGTPLRRAQDYPRSDLVFDAVSREAFKAEFGPSARALIFGHPARGGRPRQFPEAVAWVADKLGVRLTSDPIPDHYKDAGVDVIVWQPFRDERTGFRTILVQNTVQFAFSKKPNDVRPRLWTKWCNLGADPSVGFAVPFSMPLGDRWWDGATEVANVVMDRGRLMEVLHASDPSGWPEWQDLRRFVDSEVGGARRFGAFVSEPVVSVQPPRIKKSSGSVV